MALCNLEMVILQYALFSMWAFISVPARLPQELSHNCSKIACYTAQRVYIYFFILLYEIASTSTCETSFLAGLNFFTQNVRRIEETKLLISVLM